jgi:hypothetical protein
MVKTLTKINEIITEWCPQRAHLAERVALLLPAGIRGCLRTIIERRSEYTLMNNVTIVLRSRDGVGNFYVAKCVQVPDNIDGTDSLRLLARVALEMYYVDKG